MGCVVTKASEPHLINKALRLPAQPPTTSAEYPFDSSDSFKGEQQANQMGSSTVNNEPGIFKQIKTTNSIKESSPVKSDGRNKKLSHKPDLRLLSKKSSLDRSFEKEANRDDEMSSSQASPSEDISTKNNSGVHQNIQQNNAKLSNKPSGFKGLSPSLATNITDNSQKGKEELLWSLGPIQGTNFNPSFAALAREPQSNMRVITQERFDEPKKNQVQVLVNLSSFDPIQEEGPVYQNTSKVHKNSSVVSQNKNQRLKEIVESDFADRNMTATAYFGQNQPADALKIKPEYIPDKRGEAQPSPTKTLQFLDTKQMDYTVSKKSIDLPDQTIPSNTTTPVGSSGTISNLIDLCKDIKKRAGYEKNFRTNLVDLVRTESADPRSLIKKATAPPVKQVTQTQVVRRSSFESLVSQNLISNNLLHMKSEEVKDHQIPNFKKEESTPINRDDVFNDLVGMSPKQQRSPVLNKYFVLPLAKMGALNTSISKHSETSMLHDKTINLDGLSGRDFNQLSFYEQIQNIEIDEPSVLNQTRFDGGSLGVIDTIEQQTNLNLNTSALNTDYNDVSLIKSKSVPPVDHKPEDGELHELQKAYSHQFNGKTSNSESLSTLQFLSPQMNPRTLPRKRNQSINYSRADSQVIETNRVDKSVDEEGQKKINQYILIKEIGRGGFGKVKLGLNADTKEQNAIKIANKKKLKRKLLTRDKSAFTQLASEIAILKKMDHPNIVKLTEVIDDPNNDKLYLIMEYVKRGAVMSRGFWRQATRAKGLNNLQDEDISMMNKNMKLSEKKAKKYFRDLTLGMDYMHNYTEIIHRDIKPENLLINENDVLKISDFGISKIMEQGDDRLDNNAGTKFFLAPEAWGSKSFRGKPTDIWAAGGTLYYFLFGKPPFTGPGLDDLRRQVLEEEPLFPEDLDVNPQAINLIKGCLKKDPDERLTIDDIMCDPWLTDNGAIPLENEDCERLEVTDEEVKKALTKIRFLALIMVTAKVKRSLNITRRNIELRKATPDTSMIKRDLSAGSFKKILP